MAQIYRTLFLSLLVISLSACSPELTLQITELPVTATFLQATETAARIEDTATPTPEPVVTPACYQSPPPSEIATSFAVVGWQVFSARIGVSLDIFYFPPDCTSEADEQDAQRILYGDLVPDGNIVLVILNPVTDGTLGVLYQHLIQHEYWQMGPEDYPALIEDNSGLNRNLVFLRVDELNGDNTIIGNPATVMASLAEHEYIHIVQSRNNPDLARMVWTDKDYQAFIEGYANIGNVSSQRYYFETQAAIQILQNLDLMNRGGSLQDKIISALNTLGEDPSLFKSSSIQIYDQHVQNFFLRVASQAYLDGLNQGEVSPWMLFTRAGSGDISSYEVIRSINK